jgi:hypothetical protein
MDLKGFKGKKEEQKCLKWRSTREELKRTEGVEGETVKIRRNRKKVPRIREEMQITRWIKKDIRSAGRGIAAHPTREIVSRNGLVDKFSASIELTSSHGPR